MLFLHDNLVSICIFIQIPLQNNARYAALACHLRNFMFKLLDVLPVETQQQPQQQN